MLKPLIDESGHKPQSTENFIDAIKTKQIPDEQKLASFDVKSMFTSIPLQLATDYIDNATTVELPLPTDDIMDLLNFCLTSTYFQYNGKHFKQLPGSSYVLAEIFMQNTEEQAIATYTRTIPLWLRYDDDTFDTFEFTAVPAKTKNTIFTNTLTNITRTCSLARRSRKIVKYLF